MLPVISSGKMQKLLAALIIVLSLGYPDAAGAAITDPPNDSLIVRDSICDTLLVGQTGHIAIAILNGDEQITNAPKESFRKKKLIASVLAFPIPFGFIGLHRIYLGSAPWVPVAYLCTGGGGLGLLPLIDFIFIISANEEEFKKYENNPDMFMFVE